MSVALDELTDLIGDRDATRIYTAIVREYTVHLRKHATALVDGTKDAEARVVLSLLDDVDRDSAKSLTAAVADLG